MSMKRLTFFACCLILLAGCNSWRELAAIKATATEIATEITITLPGTSTLTQSLTATSTSTLKPSPTLSPTAPSTATPTPTPNPTITPSPTWLLPVNLAVQFPKPLKPITSGNISQLRQVAYFGSPVLKGFQITSDNKLGFVITTAGISVYDLATNQLKNTYDAIICTERYKACGSLALSSDGSRFALFTKNMVQVWDLDEGMILEIPLYSATRAYDRVELSPDGKIVAIVTNEATSFGPWNVKIKIYAIDTGKELTGLPDFQGGNILFSPDGTWFAEWSENKNIGGTIWRIANWSNQHDIILPADQVVKGFSQDGQSIVLQGNEQINIYQIEEWRLKRQLIVHQDQFRQTKGLYFSPSGNMIAVRENFINSTTFISEDLVSVFNISTGEKISEQTLPAGIDAFSLTNDGGLSSYQIPDEVCKEIGIELTCKKWHQWWKANVQFTNDASLFRLWRWDG